MNRFTKILHLLLCAILILSSVASCQSSDTKELSEHSASEDVVYTVKGSSHNLPKDGEITPSEYLIYYQDFEGCNYFKTNKSTFKGLGWSEESIFTGAGSNNTASFGILDYNNSKKLYIENNQSGGADSFITVLSSAMMGKYHEENYTYQYDLVYTDASNAQRYIALVSDYNGKSYNSFHLRNRGTANNECYLNGEWYAFDSENTIDSTSTDDNSIIYKILGIDYESGVQALSGIDISIRYVVDWALGNKVYLRVNTEGYPGSGVWTLVSVTDTTSEAFKQLFPDAFGGAIALKIGGKQNGYIDNIIVWRGTGEEPEDKSSALVDVFSNECSGHSMVGGATSCMDPKYCKYCGEFSESVDHEYESVNGGADKRCIECSVIESNLKSDKWFLTRVPAYIGGKYSNDVYECGQGIDDDTFGYDNESLMMIIYETTLEEFNAYCDSLVKDYDYAEVYRSTRDGNVYVQLEHKGNLVYTYYIDVNAEVRVIDDKSSYVSTEEFGYVYEKQEGDTTVLYQIGLPMNTLGTNINKSDEKKIDCGMMYAIKLADNSVLIIDGGGQQQFDDAQCDFLMDFLREITATPEGETVRIAAWYITHGHSDHMAGFCVFSAKYHDQIVLQRIMYNFASVYSDDTTQADSIKNYHKLLGYINTYYRNDNLQFVKMHTGQTFNIADVKIDIIYTHEDAVNPKNARTEVNEDYNNGSVVAIFTIDGKKFVLTGDINRIGMNILLEYNSADTLKADVVQCAHHCLNNIFEMYDLIQAPIIFMPQSPLGCKTSSRALAFSNITKYLENDMLFYASEGTYGLEVQNDEFVQTYFSECVGGEYEGWGW